MGPGGVVLPAVPTSVPDRLALAGGTWVLTEPVETYSVGQEVVWPPAAVDFGGMAFVMAAGKIVSITKVSEGTNIDDLIRQQIGQFLVADGRVLPRPLAGTI